jgi:hypothetical protein
VPARWTAIHKKLAAGPFLEASFGWRPRRRPKRMPLGRLGSSGAWRGDDFLQIAYSLG